MASKRQQRRETTLTVQATQRAQQLDEARQRARLEAATEGATSGSSLVPFGGYGGIGRQTTSGTLVAGPGVLAGPGPGAAAGVVAAGASASAGAAGGGLYVSVAGAATPAVFDLSKLLGVTTAQMIQHLNGLMGPLGGQIVVSNTSAPPPPNPNAWTCPICGEQGHAPLLVLQEAAPHNVSIQPQIRYNGRGYREVSSLTSFAGCDQCFRQLLAAFALAHDAQARVGEALAVASRALELIESGLLKVGASLDNGPLREVRVRIYNLSSSSFTLYDHGPLDDLYQLSDGMNGGAEQRNDVYAHLGTREPLYAALTWMAASLANAFDHPTLRLLTIPASQRVYLFPLALHTPPKGAACLRLTISSWSDDERSILRQWREQVWEQDGLTLFPEADGCFEFDVASAPAPY